MVAYAGSQGCVLNVTFTANYSKGDFWAKGSIAGVCLDNYASGQVGAVQVEGVFKGLPFAGQTAAVALGDKLYAADNAGTVNKLTSGGRVPVGYALSTKASSNSGTVDVLLAPGIG